MKKTLETRRLIIQAYTPDDSKKYFDLMLDTSSSEIRNLFLKNQELCKMAFENMMNDDKDLKFTISLKKMGAFVGKLLLQNIDDIVPELGIDIITQHRNQGFAPEAIIGWTNLLHQQMGFEKLMVRIDPGNSHSRHVFEKLGAEFIGQYSDMSEEIRQILCEMLPDVQDEIDHIDENGPLHFYLKLPVKTAL